MERSLKFFQKKFGVNLQNKGYYIPEQNQILISMIRLRIAESVKRQPLYTVVFLYNTALSILHTYKEKGEQRSPLTGGRSFTDSAGAVQYHFLGKLASHRFYQNFNLALFHALTFQNSKKTAIDAFCFKKNATGHQLISE